MVHDSNRLIDILLNFIRRSGEVCSYEVSDVKRDGTVFVKFRSTVRLDAVHQAKEFARHCCRSEVEFVQLDEAKFRLALEQFRPVTGVATSEEV
jgi:hypothetical protein